MSSLFDDLLSGRLKDKVISGGVVQGAREVNLDGRDVDDTSSEEEDTVDHDEIGYTKEYIKGEMELYAHMAKQDIMKEQSMMSIDDGMSEISELQQEEVYKMAHYPDIYKNYSFESTFTRKELPIDQFKSKVLNLVNVNSVVVIQGPTGCGKTTQVPQYILDDARSNKKYCNIIVTQPRKIATITVTRRVCQERGWAVGTLCGYQVGLEKKISNDTILTYCTTGVLLQKLIAIKNLHQYTHIIIDEVHERTQELDFLLLVVRKFLFTNSPRTKVILMSATIDAEELAYYFRVQSGSQAVPAPIIYVDRKSEYITQTYYADHLKNIGHLPRMDIGSPQIPEEAYVLLKHLIGVFENLDEVDPVTNEKKIGSVLVFLPGINEIEEAQKRLEDSQKRSEEARANPRNRLQAAIKMKKAIKWKIIPLHSSLPNDEQAIAFYKPQPNERKIILATNIAESSITVPDITFVIDFCLTKVMVQEPTTKYMSLVLEYASHVNCEQRAGRVGRVANGRVYRLVSKDFYFNEMKQKSIPEVLRAPLDRVVLQSKRLNLSEPPKAILALALHPPNLKNIDATIWGLKECGGLLRTCKGEESSCDGDLTFLGLVMASLPIEVHLTKLILLGHMFNVLRETIVIAAGCSIQNIFKTPYQRRFEAYKKQLLWADNSCSDLITLLNLYQVWDMSRRNNEFSQGANSERHWCDINYINLKALKEWSLLIVEITNRLKAFGIEETTGPTKPTICAQDKPLFLKVITCGAFYPNYFIRSALSGQVDEREAVRTVSGRDPFRCVYLQGMDPAQPGQLYVRQIRRLMLQGSENTTVNVGFDGSHKVYIEFDQYTKPQTIRMGGRDQLTTPYNKITDAVYEAVRKRQLKFPFAIKVFPDKEAWEYANSIKKAREDRMLQSQREERNCFSEIAPQSTLPSLDTEYIKIIITWKIDPGHFWCQNFSDESGDMLSQIEMYLNKLALTKLNANSEVELGKLYAACYDEDGKFYRCKVLFVYAPTQEKGRQVNVLFVDYGNIQVVDVEELYELPNTPACHVPALAMECVLCNLRPKVTNTGRAYYPKWVYEWFDKETDGVVLYGKVYSIVNSVVHLELYKSSKKESTSLNEFLIKKNCAEWAEESFLSQEDHQRRQAVLASECPSAEANRLTTSSKVNDYTDFECPETIEQSTKIVHLKGPFSPLEMKVYGVIQGAQGKQVDIEGDSINSVLLDTNPEDPHARLFTAAYVGQTVGGKLRLRQTTLLPRIPGLPMLMTLMFCPMMEPKLSDDCTSVTALLCGLGFHSKPSRYGMQNKALYPEHDLVLTLDTELNKDVVNVINEIRYHMNRAVKAMEEIHQTSDHYNTMIDTQANLVSCLMNILKMKLKSITPTVVKDEAQWNMLSELNVAQLAPPPQPEDEIWPLHSFVELCNLSEADRVTKSNIEELHRMAERLIPAESILCKVCGEQLETLSEIRLHLISDEHKRNAAEFLIRIRTENEDEESA